MDIVEHRGDYTSTAVIVGIVAIIAILGIALFYTNGFRLPNNGGTGNSQPGAVGGTVGGTVGGSAGGTVGGTSGGATGY